MVGFTTAAALVKARSFFGKIFSSPWLYVALVFIAVMVGTFYYLKVDKENAVEQATTEAIENAAKEATIESFETKNEIEDRTQEVDEKFIIIRERTVKDFSNARNNVRNKPVDEQVAPTPKLIIDTINELDKLHQQRRNENPIDNTQSETE